MSNRKTDLSLPRVRILGGIALAVFCVLAFRLWQIQIVSGPLLQSYLGRQHAERAKPSPRGKILDSDGNPLAISVDAVSIGIRPQKMREGGITAQQLSRLLPRYARQIDEAMRSDKAFAFLDRLAPPSVADAVENSGIDRKYFEIEATYKRYYPRQALASQILGFVGMDGHGLEGVERSFDEQLGRIGAAANYSATLAALLPDGWLESGDGGAQDVRLTIRADMQQLVETMLAKGIKWAEAKGGIAIVQDPQTGAVLAAAATPTFDPNRYGDYPNSTWRNRTIADAFEPGSTAKAFVALSALEDARIDPKKLWFCENGKWELWDREFGDDHPEAWVDLAGMVIKSSNICAAKIGLQIGAKAFSGTLAKLGYGKRVQKSLTGESKGILRPSRQWSQVDLATISFGQGIAVTPLQLATSYSILANGGRLVEPYFADALIDQAGTVTVDLRTRPGEQLFSSRSVAAVNTILQRVVDEGTGSLAQIHGIRVAGKTGTAQVPDLVNGGYLEDAYTALFAGFLPADAPRYTIVVLIERPTRSIYGGQVAAPIFRDIATELLMRDGLMPSRKKSIENPVVQAAMEFGDIEPIIVDRATQLADFRGMSLRAALRNVRELGKPVVFVGGGIVVDQKPRAGTALAEVGKVELILADRT